MSVELSLRWLLHGSLSRFSQGKFRKAQIDVPDSNKSNILSFLVFVLDSFKDGICVLASQAVPCIGVPSLCAGRRDREYEVFVCS